MIVLADTNSRYFAFRKISQFLTMTLSGLIDLYTIGLTYGRE